MKRRLRILLTFASMLALVMVMNVGAASANHENGAWEECDLEPSTCVDDAPHWAPVGQNLIGSDTGRVGLPGGPFDTDEVTPGWQGAAFDNIGRNPNCPIHWAP